MRKARRGRKSITKKIVKSIAKGIKRGIGKGTAPASKGGVRYRGGMEGMR